MNNVGRQISEGSPIDQTQAVADLSVWLSTGMGAGATLRVSSAAPAATMWHNYTSPGGQVRYLARPTVVVRRGIRRAVRRPASRPVEDLAAVHVMPQEYAAWARAMMGGEAPDMLDI